MKNIIKYILISFLFWGLMSCYDDKSKLADLRYDALAVDKSKLSEEGLVAYYKHDFKYEPRIGILKNRDTILLDESNFDNYTYQWKISMLANVTDTATRIISNERILDINMNVVQPSSDKYDLLLSVVEKETSIIYIFNFKIKVLSEYGQGLLIADTKDDVSTDINLLMTRAYNGDFNANMEDVVHRNIFTKLNGRSLNGIVSTLAYTSTYTNDKYITALVKDKNLYAFDPINYEILAENMDFFYHDPLVYKPQAFGIYDGNASFLLNNGRIHFYEYRYGMKYNFIDEYQYDFGDNFVVTYNTSGYYFGGCCFGLDKNSNGLVVFDSYGDITEYPSDNTGAFDPANLEGLKIVYGDEGNGYQFHRLFLMKEIATSKLFVYDLETDDDKHIGKPFGKSIYDLSNCQGINEASAYAFSRVFDEFYYATGNELRVAILNEETPSSLLSYSVPVGEEITHVLIHKANGKTTWNEELNSETGNMESVWRDSEDNVITIVSYNASTKEGFVRTLPIQFGGRGGIAEEKYVKTYSGFGRITAIATQN